MKIINIENFGKDKTQVTRKRGVYGIPCDCGKFCAGRTHQNLEKRQQEHKGDITKAPNYNIAAVSFDYALSSHVLKILATNTF